MCSIAGIISLDGQGMSRGDMADIVAMNHALRHRGPDGYGFCSISSQPEFCYNETVLPFAEGGRALLAHNRLAILDLNQAALQPFVSGSRKSVVVYNGELYNYIELADRYRLGPLRTTSDTEVLLELLEKNGPAVLNEFIGMWAFCYYSLERNEFVLSVDRFSQKPLYYVISGGKLYFASEMKAFLELQQVPFRFDDEAVCFYLQHGIYVTENNRTFYRDIAKIAPSHCLTVRDGRISHSVYYEPKDLSLALNEKELVAESRRLFADSIRFRSRADVPLACSLSGGVDSSTVVAFLAQELAPEKVRCYTIDVGERFENEVEAARRVAALNGCEHIAHPVRSVFGLDEVDSFITHLEEPQEFIGPIGQNELYARVSRDGYKIILDGQVGDEAFCGYYWFIPHVLIESFSRAPFAAVSTFFQYMGKRNTSFRNLLFSWKGELFPGVSFRRNHRYERRFRFPVDKRSHFLMKKLASARGWKDRQRIAYFDFELQSLLRDADRNSMRHGIENRLPFIDHRLYELTSSCDPLLLIRNGWNKYVSRSFTDDRSVPADVRWNRVKKGFYIEYPETMAAIRDRMRDAMKDEYLRSLVDFDGCLRESPEGVDDSFAWRIYNIYVLRKRFILREGCGN